MKKGKTGCWLCDYLDYYEKECFEDSSEEGWCCGFKEVEHFKEFPCKRKLKCFKPEPSTMKDEERE